MYTINMTTFLAYWLAGSARYDTLGPTSDLDLKIIYKTNTKKGLLFPSAVPEPTFDKSHIEAHFGRQVELTLIEFRDFISQVIGGKLSACEGLMCLQKNTATLYNEDSLLSYLCLVDTGRRDRPVIKQAATCELSSVVGFYGEQLFNKRQYAISYAKYCKGQRFVVDWFTKWLETGDVAGCPKGCKDSVGDINERKTLKNLAAYLRAELYLIGLLNGVTVFDADSARKASPQHYHLMAQIKNETRLLNLEKYDISLLKNPSICDSVDLEKTLTEFKEPEDKVYDRIFDLIYR